MRPPLNHMMLHEDELADEFDAILGYREMFEGIVLAGEDEPSKVLLENGTDALLTEDGDNVLKES